MSLLGRIVYRLRHVFRRGRVEAEMAEEMRFHLEQRAADYTAEGLTAAEARYAAQRKFGNVGAWQEQAREDRGWGWLERLGKDFRQAFRQLTGSPGFTVLAVVTLGLGIGVNTGTFIMFSGILLQPLPYLDVAQLVRLYRATPQNPNGFFSPADFLDLRRAQEKCGEAAAYVAGNVSLAGPGQPAEFAYAVQTTANLFKVLGVSPQLGRDFRPGEESPGDDRVIILSQRVWRNRFGGRPDAIGRMVRIDGEPHQVIGVLPQSFNDWRHLGMIDFFRPLALRPEQAADRHGAMLRVVIRRSAARAHADIVGSVANLGARLASEYPEIHAETTWRALPLQATVTGQSARPMLGLMVGLSCLVLLIACSNLANLLLARTMARAREFAVRAALGASRMQLLRPLIVESLMLAAAGGACAITLAVWIRDYLAVRSTGENGEQVFVPLDWRVFGWALLASLVTAVAFGLAPALFALRLDLTRTLKSGGRGVTGGRGHQLFRQALVVGQFAITTVLLAAAGADIRGLQELNSRRSGWDSEHLITGEILLPAGVYSDADRITAFHRKALERLRSLPGVIAASISTATPILNWTDARKFVVAGRPAPPIGREPAVMVNAVTPQYFETFGTRLLAGRLFDERDAATSPRTFIISAATARALFGEANPLGERIAPLNPGDGATPAWGEVVGVVADVESIAPDVNPVVSQIYELMAQAPRSQNVIAVRSSRFAPAGMVDDIRSAIGQLDPDLPVRRLQPAELSVARANYQVAVGRDIFTVMAVLGLSLASLGIYGIVARTMAQRVGEFAIRLALGASLGDLTRRVLASGVKLALAGSALGVVGGMAVVRLLATYNPGMRMHSAEVMGATVLLLVAIALLASWLPARRAGQLDAMAILRAE